MAGKIPHEYIDELLARVDIVDVIDGRVPLKKAGKEYKACCPFHEERTPSFTVSPDKQFYHCFGCGVHGTAIGFLMEFEHMDFREAVENLAVRVGLELPADTSGPEVKQKSLDLLTIVDEADQYYRYQLRKHPNAEAAIGYLKARGVSGEIAAEFGIGYAPDGWQNLLHSLGADNKRRQLLSVAGLLVKKEDGSFYDRFRNRIMFPIRDSRGRVVGFGGRVLGDDEPKYLNSPETPLFHKGAELYGLFKARGAIKEQQLAVVVEGYMDVVALAQFGVHNSVATLGTATTRAHLERLFRYCSEVIFCFDGDRAGRDAAWRALETTLAVLRDGRQVGFLFLPDGEDPDSLVRAEGAPGFNQRLREATPLPDYLLRSLSDQVDLTRLDGRARLIELAKPLVNQIPPGALRELLLDRVAELAQMQRASLSALAGDQPVTAAKSQAKTLKASQPPMRKSLVRVALALLLQHPRLARIAGEVDALTALESVPGVDLLAQVVHTVTEHPGLSTAALLERFRATEHAVHLEKLSIWDHMIPDEYVETEFRATLNKLQMRLRDQQTQLLLDKSRSEPLNDQEKARLRELLARGQT
jgi:DNA primase